MYLASQFLSFRRLCLRLIASVTGTCLGAIYGHVKETIIIIITRGQSNLTKSASRGPIPRLGVTPGGRKLYH